MATKKDLNRNGAEAQFTAAFASTSVLFFQKSLKEGQRECIRRIVCLKEAIIVVLPTGFGNSVIYGPEHSRRKSIVPLPPTRKRL